jgi:hypothetical protein
LAFHLACCFLFFCASWPACFAQTISVRVLNIANGRPMGNLSVEVSMLHANGSTDRPDLRLVTAANGEVQFELPKPAPSHFAVRVELSDKDWYCDCLTFVSTQDVIEKGFMSKLPESKRSQSERVTGPRPGEIVLRAKPTPWWVRILYPLEKY